MLASATNPYLTYNIWEVQVQLHTFDSVRSVCQQPIPAKWPLWSATEANLKSNCAVEAPYQYQVDERDILYGLEEFL
jgi:hypothetical protein